MKLPTDDEIEQQAKEASGFIFSQSTVTGYAYGAKWMRDQVKPEIEKLEAEIERLKEFEFRYKGLCK